MGRHAGPVEKLERREGVVLRAPERSEIAMPVTERPVIDRYEEPAELRKATVKLAHRAGAELER